MEMFQGATYDMCPMVNSMHMWNDCPACMHRQDPPSKDQFGDGKYAVEWTKDLEKYEQWWAQGTRHTQQLARQLEEQGRPKSAARVSQDY